jgi:hypothetical protein
MQDGKATSWYVTPGQNFAKALMKFANVKQEYVWGLGVSTEEHL